MLLEFAAVTLLANAHTGKLISGYPSRITAHPGSAIKPFVLVALLEAKVLPAKPTYICPGRLTLEGRNFTCSHPAVRDAMEARIALAYSCNNFFSHYAALLPPGALERTFARYGLAGASNRTIEALGEGALTVTPSQMMEAYRRLALEHNPEVSTALRQVVQYGTGQLGEVTGLFVAGKTGTSSPSYAWFAGFAPASNPDYVFAVLTRQASGGTGAAPLARKALLHQLGRDSELAVLTPAGLSSLTLDEYVAGVLGGEAASLHSTEALKAMAVAARTFAVKMRGRHSADGYDFCGSTHCQSFRPSQVISAIRTAVADTAGELLWRDGSLAETFYSQDCSSHWSTTITSAEMHNALEAAHLHIPPVLAPRVLERDPQGRVLRLDLGDGVPLAASSFRMALGRSAGWNRIRSDFYDLSALTFTGTGAGNQTGLCQRDADRMSGSYRQILGAFYPGTRTGFTAQGLAWHPLSGERLEVWSTSPWQDRALVGQAEQELRFAEETTGWPAAVRPRIQVFPTVATFRDSTGESGAIAASTKGRIIRLQPAGRTRLVLRHELLHVLIGQHARDNLPLWFQEGLALALTGGPVPGDSNYLSYRRRTEEAIRHFGKEAVLNWVKTGVPAQVGTNVR